MKDIFKRYIEANSREIVIFISIILIGILVGIGSYNLLNIESKQNLYELCNDFLEVIKGENFAGIDIFWNNVMNNLGLIIIIFVASLTIIGFPLISIILFIKGAGIGFFVAVIFSIFGVYKGMLYTLILVLLPNLLFIPLIVVLAITAATFSSNLTYISKIDRKWTYIIKYIAKLLGFIIVMIIPIIFENYIIRLFILAYLNLG